MFALPRWFVSFFKSNTSKCTKCSLYTNGTRDTGGARARFPRRGLKASPRRASSEYTGTEGCIILYKLLINRDLARQHGAETCPALSLANDNNEALRRASRRLGQTAAQSTIARPTAAPFAATETRLQKDCKAASVRADAAQCCITFRFRKQHPSPPSACSPLLQ